VDSAPDGGAAISQLDAEPYDLVITDLKMPTVGGMELLAWCRAHHPGLPVILITAYGTVDSAVGAIKAGAFDYITKPFDQEELRQRVTTALRVEEAARAHMTAEPGGRFELIGQTNTMRGIYDLIGRVASSPTTVLITGESGTGKELVARALHKSSERRDAPFIQVNCGAIPESLFESELFGHERGAFTGAVVARQGRFELADGGTLFLDEVGELPKDMQVKLLRVLQDRSFVRVGGTRSLSVDVRLVAATNRDLDRDVRDGRFREDLFYRLNVIRIRLPPLRERPEDIPLLVEHFLGRFNRRLDRAIRGLSVEAMATLQGWPWPGNIRELENVMERAVLLSQGDIITPADLGDGLAPTSPGAEEDEEGPGGLQLKDLVRQNTMRLERARIQRVLDEEAHNVTRAARVLGISRKSLQMKMKEYGLREER
jgi:DNA-binding NtrC family response regulator